MPVYNCAQYVGEAIDSVLNQTYTDFEFLIIDDASTDKTVSIIKAYKDSRIKLIEKPKNTGYTNSLNSGLTIANGEYIARMDGDDISLPERFAKQVAFMDTHPDIVACGTAYSIIGSELVKRFPKNHEDLKIILLNKTCFGHPTVMLRLSVIKEHSVTYDITKEPAEDYDLWVRLLAYGKFCNLPEVLLDYRVHDNQVSVKKSEQKYRSYYIIKRNILNYLNISFSEQEKELLEEIICRQIISYKNFKTYKSLKNKLILANEKAVFEPSGFDAYLKEMDFLVCKDYFLNRKKYFPNILVHYAKFNKAFGYKLSLKDTYKLFIKSLIFYTK